MKLALIDTPKGPCIVNAATGEEVENEIHSIKTEWPELSLGMPPGNVTLVHLVFELNHVPLIPSSDEERGDYSFN